jgi:beta-phosphoglucomutase-like phosphatase (HAD superfamily)
VDSIAGAQSALSAALKVVIVLGGGGDHPGPLRVLAGWW